MATKLLPHIKHPTNATLHNYALACHAASIYIHRASYIPIVQHYVAIDSNPC